MRRIVFVCLALLLATTYGHAQAKPFAGTWKIDMELLGNSLAETCTLHNESSKLKGTCVMEDGSQADIVGDLEGTNISFKHMADIAGNSVAMSFVGKVADDGNFAGDMGIDAFGMSTPFTAKRAADKK